MSYLISGVAVGRLVLILAIVWLAACDRSGHDHAHHEQGAAHESAEYASGHDHHHGHDHHQGHDHHGHDHHHHHPGLNIQGRSGHHGAHAHGIGSLSFVLEGSQLSLELIVSGMDAVGFETHPANDAQRERVAAAADFLRDPTQFLRFTGAGGCELKDTEVLSTLLEEHAQEERGHAEFYVYYAFTCAHPQALSGIEWRAFEHFPALQRIELQWVREDLQGASVILPPQPEVAIPAP